jgi:predicted dehydrogenase
VSARLATVSLTRGPVDDSFAVRFRLKSGLEGIMQQSCGALGPLTQLTEIAGDKGRIWLDGTSVKVADAAGERELSIPADVALPLPPPLTDDPRNARFDWQAMAYVEIAPFTELCKTFRALIERRAPTSPVPPATFAEGLANMRVLDAIRTSARKAGELVSME